MNEGKKFEECSASGKKIEGSADKSKKCESTTNNIKECFTPKNTKSNMKSGDSISLNSSPQMAVEDSPKSGSRSPLSSSKKPITLIFPNYVTMVKLDDSSQLATEYTMHKDLINVIHGPTGLDKFYRVKNYLYLVKHNETGKIYFLKLKQKIKNVEADNCQFEYINEPEAFKIINNECKNIAKPILSIDNDKFTIILFEKYTTDLLDYTLSLKNIMPHEYILTCAKQIYSALIFLLSKNILYIDLKPENILLLNETNNKFHSILTDIDLYIPMDIWNNSSQDGVELYNCGKEIYYRTDKINSTASYYSPEVHYDSMYSKKLISWQFGMILYIMYHNCPPINTAMLNSFREENLQYGITCHYNHKVCSINKNNVLNEKMCTLIENLLIFDPEKRMRIEDVGLILDSIVL